MRNITKGPSPASLEQYRRNDSATYNDIPTTIKDDIRAALVTEQRGICCYCMGRIASSSDRMKIEHWLPRNPEGQNLGADLDYSNMLGACIGGEGNRPAEQHCDTFRKNRPLNRNPANTAHDVESPIRYTNGGAIESDNNELHDDIKTLNLNCETLKGYRVTAIKTLNAVLDKKQGARTRRVREDLLDKYNGLQRGDLDPFCQVAIYFLKKSLTKSR